MSCRPTLGVVVATHERPVLLRACLDSLTRQTVPPDQVIVVDDGRIESAEEVASSFGDRLPITFAHSGGKGVGAARNIGVGLTDADWVVIQDDDDLMLPQRLERHIRDIQTRHIDVSYGGWINFDVMSQSLEFFPGKALTVEAFFLAGLVLTHGAAAVRRDLLEAYCYSEAHAAGVDFELFARLLMDGAIFAHCGGYLLLRRLHAVRLGAQENSTQLNLRREVLDRWITPWPDIEARRAQGAAQPFFPAMLSEDDVAAIRRVGVEPRRILAPVNRRWERAKPLVEVLTGAGLSPRVIDPGSGARVTLEAPLSRVDDSALARLSTELGVHNSLIQWRGNEPQGGAPVLQSPISRCPGRELVISAPSLLSLAAIVDRLGASKWLWSLSCTSPAASRCETLSAADFEAITAVAIDQSFRELGAECWLTTASA